MPPFRGPSQLRAKVSPSRASEAVEQDVQVGELSRNPYSAGISKAASSSTVNNSSSLKEKIGRMFHLNTPG